MSTKTAERPVGGRIRVGPVAHAKYLALKQAKGISITAAAERGIDLLLKREGVKVSG